MDAWHVVALGTCILCTSVAQLCMKYGAVKSTSVQKSLINPFVLFAYGLFGVVTVLSVFVMQQIELKAFNAWSSLIYLLVVLGSSGLLKESINRIQWLGMLFVFCGMGLFF